MKFFKTLFHLAFHLMSMLQHVFNGSVLLNQCLCSLFSYPWNTRNIIYRITPKSKYIYNLIHSLYFPTIQDLLYSQNFIRIAHSTGLVYVNIFANQLPEVFIRSHHINIYLLIKTPCQSTNNIIGFVTIHGDHRYIKSFKNSDYVGQTLPQIFRHRVTLCLIFFKFNVSLSGFICIKYHS